MAHRVFIVWVNPLFCESIRMVLSHANITVIGDSSDSQAARAEIDELHPDVVIVEASEDEPSNRAATLRMLDESQWALRVVRLSLQDNEVWLYHREQMTVGTPDDLLQLILRG